MVKKGGKSQTGTMTSDQINDAIDIQNATAKTYDQYPKGSTRIKKEDGRRNVPIIEDVRKDPYAKVRTAKKHEASSGEGGNPLNIETNFDKKAYKEMSED